MTAIRTLGDLRDHDMSISFYCADPKCARLLGLTMELAIELFGADQRYVGWQPQGIKCSECGCRHTTIVIQAVPFGYGMPRR
ncbi:hypothetical protein [Aurantimonas sp. 22II-16-19i]|uniref:hypothetical protein n=1 Tax=Aurantimonas sp. 22II-16-19i TaxID=1317114 RepID=UPI0009F7F9CA|nr:hypothetical protein [Aurantimonas sp. 22II-16-19i]ORE93944.1 hypothetical protein ATO4_14359 [Aurantimonas sp. 22II-16-19i]